MSTSPCSRAANRGDIASHAATKSTTLDPPNGAPLAGVICSSIVGRLAQLLEAGVDRVGQHLHEVELLDVDALVLLDEAEERLGRHVRVAPVALEEGLARAVHARVHGAHVPDELLAHRGVALQLVEGADEVGGDVGERLLGPREEPVNGGAVCAKKTK